jgi:methionyl aminopeptidase
MDIEPHPDFLRAGEIAGRVLERVSQEIKPGVKLLKVCSMAEEQIMELGASGLAFPCNISINNEAAHYTSPHGDQKVFPAQGLVKIDIGAHVNGHISDTALTVDLDGSYDRYIHAAREALEAAIEVIRPGIRLGEVGSAIERTMKKHGLRPVHQLTGHQLKPWNLHAGKNVPNFGMRSLASMSLGETFAVEPFATNGNGTIRNGPKSFIFSNDLKSKKKLDRNTLRVRNVARQAYGSLPWASRWLHGRISGVDIDASINIMQKAGVIHGYPVLFEGKDGMVSQFEHSLFVSRDGAIVSTRRPSETE